MIKKVERHVEARHEGSIQAARPVSISPWNVSRVVGLRGTARLAHGWKLHRLPFMRSCGELEGWGCGESCCSVPCNSGTHATVPVYYQPDLAILSPYFKAASLLIQNPQTWAARHTVTWRLRLRVRLIRSWRSGPLANRSTTSIATVCEIGRAHV